jgi:aspartate/methionine/tyrosine aminotransferase
MPSVSNRVSHFTESVIRRMTRVADAHQAINLSQGFPDFDPPPQLLQALRDAVDSGRHQYFMGLPIDANDNIVVTCGSTEAMMAAMLAVCNPGDKVVVFSPFYENYGADAILSGAIPIYVPLRAPEFSFDPAELRAAFEQRPKAIIVCNPSNPSGKVFTKQELLAIAGLAEEFDAFVITDEVYEHIVYEPHRHVYFAALPGMFGRTISCSSLSKTYSITGWRLGYVVGPAIVVDAIRKVHDFLTVGAAAPLQQAAVTALGFPDAYYHDLQALYARKREVFLGALDAAGLTYTRPQGAYYVLVDIAEFGAASDVDFCEWLTRQVGVAAVPGSSFFREPVRTLIRFHFAKKEETLLEAGRRLQRIRAEWKRRG